MDACSLRMELAQTLALRTALSIDENDIPNEEIICMGTALQSFLQDIISKIDAAQILTEVDLSLVYQNIRGIMFCLKETLREMNLSKSHTCNTFFLVRDSMEMFSVDIEALADEINDTAARVLTAYKQAEPSTGNQPAYAPAAKEKAQVA